MTKTTNYQLPKWEETDRIQMEDFNADNAKIDAALAAIPHIAAGTYIGDGAETRTIPLDFTPRIVYLCNKNGLVYAASGIYRTYYGGLFTAEAPIEDEYNNIANQIVENGFTVHCRQDSSNYNSMCHFSNENGQTYRYVAVK